MMLHVSQREGAQRLDNLNFHCCSVLNTSTQWKYRHTQPENFTVEGAPKEITTQKLKKTNKQKEAKRKRSRGEEYLSPNTNKLVGDRKMGEGCQSSSCEKAGRKCFTVAENSRADVFNGNLLPGTLNVSRLNE